MKKFLKNVLEYIIAICIIMNTNTIFSNNYKFDNINLMILFFSLMLYILISIRVLKEKKEICMKLILFSIFICVYNLGYVLLSDKRENIRRYFLIFILILIPLIIYYVIKMLDADKYSLLIKISNVILILAIVSLVFYFLGSIFNVIHPTHNVLINWGNVRNIPSYFNCYYETQVISLNGVYVIRNSGIFTEAPMYSFSLCISLIIKIFFDKKRNIKSIFILIVTIITTYSTTGITVVAIVLFFNWLLKKNINKIIRILKMMIIPLIFIIGLIGLLNIFSGKQKTDSYSIRIDDYKIAFKAFKNHPIIGNGFGTIGDQIMKYTTVSRPNNGGSSGFNSIISDGGLYLSFIYFTPFLIMLIYYLKNKNNRKAIVVITLILLLVTTSVSYRGIMINFLALMWAKVLGLSYKNKCCEE